MIVGAMPVGLGVSRHSGGAMLVLRGERQRRQAGRLSSGETATATGGTPILRGNGNGDRRDACPPGKQQRRQAGRLSSGGTTTATGGTPVLRGAHAPRVHSLAPRQRNLEACCLESRHDHQMVNASDRVVAGVGARRRTRGACAPQIPSAWFSGSESVATGVARTAVCTHVTCTHVTVDKQTENGLE